VAAGRARDRHPRRATSRCNEVARSRGRRGHVSCRCARRTGRSTSRGPCARSCAPKHVADRVETRRTRRRARCRPRRSCASCFALGPRVFIDEVLPLSSSTTPADRVPGRRGTSAAVSLGVNGRRAFGLAGIPDRLAGDARTSSWREQLVAFQALPDDLQRRAVRAAGERSRCAPRTPCWPAPRAAPCTPTCRCWRTSSPAATTSAGVPPRAAGTVALMELSGHGPDRRLSPARLGRRAGRDDPARLRLRLGRATRSASATREAGMPEALSRLRAVHQHLARRYGFLDGAGSAPPRCLSGVAITWAVVAAAGGVP